MSNKRISTIGITMGDPAGIGPEIICKSLADPDVYETCRPIVIGNIHVLEKVQKAIGSNQKVHPISDPSEAIFQPQTINVIDVPSEYEFLPGVLHVENGKAAISYMEKAYELIKSGKIDGTASAPCNKEAMKKAGLPCVGATEFYALLSGAKKSYAVIEQAGCYIFQLTSHLPLKKAIEKITEDFVYQNLLIFYRTLQTWGIASPKLALSGFNPHAGDGGSMGSEDLDILAPAVKAASLELGCDIFGPVPADALYQKGSQGVYDGIVYLFHDTANIPVKLMEKYYPSVVITGGLPFIRTTVAHGTAYDIAYQGIAGHQQMKNAIIAAGKIGTRLLNAD